MNDREIKELLAKHSTICKDAETSIRDMKIKLSKYKGDKTEQTKNLQNLDNLLNLAHKQAVDIMQANDLIAKYLFKIGEQNYKLRELTEQYDISEKIHEVGIDKVIEDFKNRVI